MPVGFVGLGTMGHPMAGHLVRAGHEVVTWNRSAGRPPVTGARQAESLVALAADCEVVMLCVRGSEDVGEVVHAMRPEISACRLIVDHSTIDPSAASNLSAELSNDGVEFLDAPITGGSMGAQNGTLTIFCGGAPDTFQQAKPYLQAYGRRVEHVGASGQGQLMKLANQIAVGGALLALCESLAFAQRAGLDVAQARELIGSGAAGSWAFENYGPKILSQDWTPGFSVDNQRKDFGYCLEAASNLGLSIPGTELVDLLLSELQKSGRGGDTTAALFDVLTREN